MFIFCVVTAVRIHVCIVTVVSVHVLFRDRGTREKSLKSSGKENGRYENRAKGTAK